MSEYPLTAFYEKAITAISEGIGIDRFTQLVYDTFRIPIIAVDEGYQMLAYANDGFFTDPYWEAIVQSGSPSDHTIVNCYLKEGYLDAITQADGAIYVDWGVSKNYPQTSGPIYVNGQLEGFVSLLFLDETKKDLSLKLNGILCKLYAILLQTNSLQKKTAQKTIREVFARKLFDTQKETEPLDPANYRPFIDVKPGFSIAVICSVRDNDITLEHIRGRIRSYRPNILYLYLNRLLYLFIYGIHINEETSVLSGLADFLSAYEIYIGCSCIFDNLSKRAVYIQQAEYALKAGCLVHPKQTLFFYSDYYLQAMLLPPSQTFFPENAVPAEILKLHDFDCQNQTNYLETLKIYLFERNNLNKAASNLHLHRNTLKYRLDKIEDMICAPLDDPAVAQRLQLGLLLSDMMEHI